MFEKCDMHLHTTESDGELSCLSILHYANKNKRKKISITDHDDIDFYFNKSAMKYAKENNFDLITGCEFVCSVDKIPIEILGYGIDIEGARKYLEKNAITQNSLERFRSENAPNVFKRLGIRLDYNPRKIDFNKKDPRVLPAILASVRKNKKAVDLIKNENPSALKGVSPFLRLTLNNVHSKLYMDTSKFYPSYKKIINLIHKLGGLAFVAHPYQYNESMEKVLEKTREAGVDGIECYHFTTIVGNRAKYLKNYCKKHNLLISGGSDFHRIGDKCIENSRLNKLRIPCKYFNKIKKILEKKSSPKK